MIKTNTSFFHAVEYKMNTKTKDNFLIIFDFDGVIVDSKDAYALQMQDTIEKVSGLKIDKRVFEERVGNTDQKSDFIEFLKTEETEIISQAVQIYASLTDKYSSLRKLFPKVRTSLFRINKKYYTGIVSRKSQNRLERWLEYYEIADFFDVVIGTLENSKAKAILRIAEKLSVSKENTVMIGDTEFDIISAKEAEVISIVAMYGITQPKKVLELKPDYQIRSFDEIELLVEQIRLEK